LTVTPPVAMSSVELELWIEMLTAGRSAARRAGKADAARSMQAELDEAWDLLRRRRAQQAHGPADAIIKRARVERELEKLQGDA
jgi:hypothetical protein